MINLSKRLEAISSLVPNNSKVIDIGCDHGLLGIFLYQQKKGIKVIESDINKNALNNAKENIKKYGLVDNIETRLGDGLNSLKESDDIDTIIISGMGAHTIVEILTKDINKLKGINTIIIQSNTKIELLRKEITKLNYLIEDEILIEDSKKIYTIIKFTKGKKKYSKAEIFFGPILLKQNSALFKNKNEQELERLKTLYKSLPKNKLIEKYKLKKKIIMYEKHI